MKRNYGALAVLFVALVGVGIWWFAQPTPAASGESAVAATPAKVTALSPGNKPPQVELPQTPAVPASNKTVAASSTDPLVDLKTAIADMASLVRAGEFGMFARTYQTPDFLKSNPQYLERVKDVSAPDAAEQKLDESIAESYAALGSQTPTLNASGDEATYQFSRGVFGGPVPLTFIRINGQWYIKQATGDNIYSGSSNGMYAGSSTH